MMQSVLRHNHQMPSLSQGANNGCGTTSLATIMQVLGVAVSPQQIDRNIRRSDTLTSPYRMISFARLHGLSAEIYADATLEDAAQHLAEGHLVQALIKSHHSHRVPNHYVVVLAIDGTAVTLRDPARGMDVMVSRADFALRWIPKNGELAGLMLVYADKGVALPRRPIMRAAHALAVMDIANAAGDAGEVLTRHDLADRLAASYGSERAGELSHYVDAGKFFGGGGGSFGSFSGSSFNYDFSAVSSWQAANFTMPQSSLIAPTPQFQNTFYSNTPASFDFNAMAIATIFANNPGQSGTGIFTPTAPVTSAETVPAPSGPAHVEPPPVQVPLSAPEPVYANFTPTAPLTPAETVSAPSGPAHVEAPPVQVPLSAPEPVYANFAVPIDVEPASIDNMTAFSFAAPVAMLAPGYDTPVATPTSPSYLEPGFLQSLQPATFVFAPANDVGNAGMAGSSSSGFDGTSTTSAPLSAQISMNSEFTIDPAMADGVQSIEGLTSPTLSATPANHPLPIVKSGTISSPSQAETPAYLNPAYIQTLQPSEIALFALPGNSGKPGMTMAGTFADTGVFEVNGGNPIPLTLAEDSPFDSLTLVWDQVSSHIKLNPGDTDYRVIDVVEQSVTPARTVYEPPQVSIDPNPTDEDYTVLSTVSGFMPITPGMGEKKSVVGSPVKPVIVVQALVPPLERSAVGAQFAIGTLQEVSVFAKILSGTFQEGFVVGIPGSVLNPPASLSPFASFKSAVGLEAKVPTGQTLGASRVISSYSYVHDHASKSLVFPEVYEASVKIPLFPNASLKLAVGTNGSHDTPNLIGSFTFELAGEKKGDSLRFGEMKGKVGVFVNGMVAADGSRDTGLVTYSLSSQLQELGLSQSAAQFLTPILTRTAIPGIYATVQSVENFAMDAIRDGLQNAVQKSASDYGETSRIQWQMLGNGFQGLIKNLMDPYPVSNGGLSNNEYSFAAPASSFASDLNSVLSKVSTPTYEILNFSVGLGEQSATTRINGLMFGIGSQTPSSQNLPVPNWTSGIVVEPTPVQPVPSLSNAAGLGVQSTPVPAAPNLGTAAGIGGESQRVFHEQNWEPAAEAGRPVDNYLESQGLPPVSDWEPAQNIIPSDVRRVFGL